MIKAQEFLNKCKEYGYDFFTGTPCSYLKPFINCAISDDNFEFVSSVNEGDAVAIATGCWLAGRKPVVMFQNSGLGNAVNPLTSLSYTFRAPFLGIVTLRGEPGGKPDEPQHELMGQITTQMLELMKIPWSYFPQSTDEINTTLKQAVESMEAKSLPYFLVMRDGDIEEYDLDSKPNELKPHEVYYFEKNYKQAIKTNRTEALKTITHAIGDHAFYIATTGKCGRELFDLEDKVNQFYMVGSMGCALPLGLGMSFTKNKDTICVIDGDGALLMRTGSMATAGILKPKNFVHVLLDNGVHDSTGGQKTGSENVDFALLAKSFGYQDILSTDDAMELEKFLIQAKTHGRLSFVHFLIKPGSPKKLGRPTLAPDFLARRFRTHFMQRL